MVVRDRPLCEVVAGGGGWDSIRREFGQQPVHGGCSKWVQRVRFVVTDAGWVCGDQSGRLPVVETPAEQPPTADGAASPPQRGVSDQDLRVVETIGSGGQAVIREAWMPDSHHPPETVAVREPPLKSPFDKEATEEFHSQAEA